MMAILPDVMVLCPGWPERAYLRAQLIEEGYEVVAIESWPMPRAYRQTGMTPRLLLIELQGLPSPRQTLDEVRVVLPAQRVLVVLAQGTLPAVEVERLGFNVIVRPATVAQIVAATAALLGRNASPDVPERVT
jgi:hypothetical protein